METISHFFPLEIPFNVPIIQLIPKISTLFKLTGKDEYFLLQLKLDADGKLFIGAKLHCHLSLLDQGVDTPTYLAVYPVQLCLEVK